MRHLILLSRKTQLAQQAPYAVTAHEPLWHAREGNTVYVWLSQFMPILWQPDDSNSFSSIQLRLPRSVHASATTLVEWMRHAETITIHPDPIPPAIVIADCFVRRSGKERQITGDEYYRRLRRWHYAVGAVDAYLYPIRLADMVGAICRPDERPIIIDLPQGKAYGCLFPSPIRPLKISLAPRRVIPPSPNPWIVSAIANGWNHHTLIDRILNAADKTAWPFFRHYESLGPVTVLHLLDQKNTIGHAIATCRVDAPHNAVPYRIQKRPLGVSWAIETCLFPHTQLLPPPQETTLETSDRDTLLQIATLIHDFTFGRMSGEQYCQKIASALSSSPYIRHARSQP